MDFICPYTCSYRTSSGYCGSTGGWERCQYRQLHQTNTVVGYVPPLKKTNADRIRAMTDEELARFVTTEDLCELTCNSSIPCDGRCEAKMLEWLKQEAKNA